MSSCVARTGAWRYLDMVSMASSPLSSRRKSPLPPCRSLTARAFDTAKEAWGEKRQYNLGWIFAQAKAGRRYLQLMALAGIVIAAGNISMAAILKAFAGQALSPKCSGRPSPSWALQGADFLGNGIKNLLDGIRLLTRPKRRS